MPKNWLTWTHQGDITPIGDPIDFELSLAVGRPATLLRTLLWYGASCIIDAQELSGEATVAPFAFHLEDTFSHNNPGDFHGGGVWDFTLYDLVATQYDDWSYSLGQSGTHLVGPASIGLSGDLVYDVSITQQRLAYIFTKGHIDSHAQRVWYAPNAVGFHWDIEWSPITPGTNVTPVNTHYWVAARFLISTI